MEKLELLASIIASGVVQCPDDFAPEKEDEIASHVATFSLQVALEILHQAAKLKKDFVKGGTR
jgi:hypothetical protein